MPYAPCGSNRRKRIWPEHEAGHGSLVLTFRHLELCILMRDLRLFVVELHTFQPVQLSQYNYWLRAERREFDLHQGGYFSSLV
jgi:hypothetical protein